METMTYTGKLIVTTCWCGTVYAIPQTLYEFVDGQHRDGRPQTDIYCPLGHRWTFAGEGDAAKLRKQLDRAQQQLASREEDLRSEKASHVATKGLLTKAKKRASRGVCPHPDCHRSFANVERHVATCHPELLIEPS